MSKDINTKGELTLNKCEGCKYENCDDTTDDISNCVCCNRINELAKYDFYKPKKKGKKNV
jgi:hypothetical protein